MIQISDYISPIDVGDSLPEGFEISTLIQVPEFDSIEDSSEFLFKSGLRCSRSRLVEGAVILSYSAMDFTSAIILTGERTPSHTYDFLITMHRARLWDPSSVMGRDFGKKK